MTTPTAPPTPPTPPTTLTTLTARSPEDLLAVAPVVLGFWPSNSVVMLTFGARHPFHARVDLPLGADDTVVLDEITETLIAPAAHHGATRVVLLVYSGDEALADACWEALAAGFDRVGIDVVEAVRVDTARWYPLRGHARLRGRGVPYDVSSHPFLVQAILDGRVTHESRTDLAATLQPDPPAVARVADLVTSQRPDHDPLVVGAWVESLVLNHLDVEGATPSDLEVARLVTGMQSLSLRDAAWTTITRERSRASVDFWTEVLRRTPDFLVAAPAALLAWSAWQHGNGALAWCAIDRCREIDPDYSLATLLAEMLERAVPPSAWSGSFDCKEGLEGRRSG